MKDNIHVLVRNIEQLDACLELGLTSLYTDNLELWKDNQSLIYRPSRVGFENNNFHKILAPTTAYLGLNNLNVITDYPLNVANLKTIEVLKKLNVQRICLSVELTNEQILALKKEAPSLEILVYGRVELMILKSYPINNTLEYTVIDRNEECYPLYKDHNNLTHLFNYKNINKLASLPMFYQNGFRHFRIDLLKESKEETKKLLQEILQILGDCFDT